MVSPILGRNKFKIFYYLPAPLNCPLRYELGPKSWDRAKTYKGINEFANACEAIDCNGVFERDKFMSGYDWLRPEI